jgi:hypothetical protein
VADTCIVLEAHPIRLTISEDPDVSALDDGMNALEAFASSWTTSAQIIPLRAVVVAASDHTYTISLYSEDASVMQFIIQMYVGARHAESWRDRCLKITDAIDWEHLEALSVDIEELSMAQHIFNAVNDVNWGLSELHLFSEACFACFSAVSTENEESGRLCFLRMQIMYVNEVRMIRDTDRSASSRLLDGQVPE